MHIPKQKFLTAALHRMVVASQRNDFDAYEAAYHDLLQCADDQMELLRPPPVAKRRKTGGQE